MRVSLATLAIFTLTACGGGGGSTTPTTPVVDGRFADPVSQQSEDLLAATMTTATRSTAGQTGTLNRAGDGFSLGALTGAINDDRTLVTLGGGGFVTLDAGANDFALRFEATPQTGDATRGIVGIATALDDIPTGSVSYAGTSVVTISDNLTVYDLRGDATVQADFAAGAVTTTINGLNGTSEADSGGPQVVTDLGSITFSGSAISSAGYSGGTAEVDAAALPALTNSAASSLQGAIFGPGGRETGGVFIINDTAEGNVTIFGDFIAK